MARAPALSAGGDGDGDAAGPVAELRGVTHRYGDTIALRQVDLAVPRGCLAGLIGPDGVGKSTLLGLLAGTRRVQSGTVRALGGDLRSRRHRRAVTPDVAYVSQGLGTNLYPDLSVQENVDFFGRLFGLPAGERRERIEALLRATGLARFRDRRARNLSGGMKQKLGLCCALIHDPRLLVLDEPTTGVDPLSRRQFWDLIAGMRGRRPDMSVVVATAYMEEAEGFDWLAVLDGGRVLATGSPGEILERTGQDSLEGAFVALLPEDKRGRRRRPEAPPYRAAGQGGAAIEARDLTKRFGDFTAVDRVSFEIRQGEVFGFVGSNGCGKTTTMKMLTGLLPATEGDAHLFGRRLDARDMATRRRVGFMTQSFSLYGELSVRRNLELHARLYGAPAERADRVMARFGIAEAQDTLAESLPLGIRQRLSLAVALIHEPEVLILDEPTSGVDPVARDAFWADLLELSRRDGVTIFLSTHFMNEAERADRVALMHRGRVLAVGPPEELARRRGSASLEEAFVDWLREEEEEEAAAEPASGGPLAAGRGGPDARPAARFDPRRLWAIARREAREIRRDPVRLAFALLGPVLLLIVTGWGISFDVENLDFAVLDRDRTPESRRYLEGFQGSRYFRERRPIADDPELEARLRSGELAVAIEIPPGFGRDLWAGEEPQIGVFLDGAMPFKAETTRGYVLGVHQRYLEALGRRSGDGGPRAPPIRMEPRFRYNQEFESVYAIVPGVIMLILVLIPSVMTAVGVVREKELGSIVNLYGTPATRVEFLLGKQLPYVAVGFASFLLLVALALGLFRVPVEGSFPALALGALLYVVATTGLGLVISAFVKTQLAAIFAAAILTTLPATQFSGLLSPVSSLTGGARIFGLSFPSSYFHTVSVGTFSKQLGMGDLLVPYAALAGFALAYLAAACALLRSQAR